MIIQELFDKTISLFETAKVDEARANAEFLLSSILGLKRTSLFLHLEETFPQEKLAVLDNFIKRKIKGEHVSYILGTADFCGNTFVVNKNVLIPRPETEELFLYSKNIFQDYLIYKENKNLKVLDLCCGSGCLGLTFALTFPKVEVVCADISKPALEVAKENAQNLNVKNVEFIESDLFSNIKGTFDLIITNPPYIPTDVLPTLSLEVQQEPLLALDGGKEGLVLIKKICEVAPKHLKEKSSLCMEIGIDEAQKVLQFLSKDIWLNSCSKQDFSGIERFIIASKK